MQGLFFFVFSKYRVEERFSNIYLRNHAILWAIFGSQIGFDSQFQLREQLKKLHFSLWNWYKPLFEKNLSWTRFLGLAFEILFKKKVHHSINNYKIVILVFLIFWFRELSILQFCNIWDCLLEVGIWRMCRWKCTC